MEIYEFKSMDGISKERLIEAFGRMCDSERNKIYLFDEDEYEWYIGGAVYMRFKDTFDSWRCQCNIDSYKILGINLKILSPGVMPNCIILDEKESKGIGSYKKYSTGTYETKRVKRMSNCMDCFLKVTPKKVIFNNPATIVFWTDGSKTIVKATGEPFDKEKGLAMAIAKKHLGNEGNYYDIFRKWLPKEETPEEQHLEKDDNSTHITRSFNILTADEFAERVNNSSAAIIAACEVGLYPGARKVMGEWLIPWFKISEV